LKNAFIWREASPYTIVWILRFEGALLHWPTPRQSQAQGMPF
jgi:hypothetical protein